MMVRSERIRSLNTQSGASTRERINQLCRYIKPAQRPKDRGASEPHNRLRELTSTISRDSPKASPLTKTMHPSEPNEGPSQASTHRSAVVSLRLEPGPS